ncbi:hypothetical protein [uncultured Methanolobus sp.]|uniref:COG1470 family protein n=1 Tax=uncultured Methanolobus sp. TaxID=218300 RepID=UPI0029C71834|nr:hypothetical protein [uncultured Methanolobus sp.]
MNKTPLYITMGLLLVSAVFATGAMADDAVPLMKPLVSERSFAGLSYAEEVEAISIPDMGYGTLQVKPSYSYLQLQPGETSSVSIIVINRDDEAVTIDPIMVLQPYTENYLEEEWVTVTPSNITMQPDEEKEFTVEVAIPDDADLGYYNANIVFDRSSVSDDGGDIEADYKISSIYYGNSLDLSVEVWMPPSIQVSSNYINDKVEAGKEYDYEIKLVNVGDRDIAISPEIITSKMSPEISYYDPGRASFDEVFGEDSITIDAPSKVIAGETESVKIHMKIPEGVQGSYSTSIDLGIDDPALNEWENQVQLYLNVWEQPSEPFITEFSTFSDAPVRIEVSTNQYEYSGYEGGSAKQQPSFDLVLKKGAKEIELTLVKTMSKGSVNFGNNDVILYSSVSSAYKQYSTTYTEVYEATGGVGEWELSILSGNTDNFEYSITVGDSE